MPAFISVLMLILACGSAFASSQGKGKVILTGEIIESACAIATDNVWQEINFGDVPLTEFSEGRLPEQKTFSIHLINCDLKKQDGGVWSTVSVTFDGPSAPMAADMFAMSGNGSGIGLHIINESGRHITPGQAEPGEPLKNERTDLHYRIQLARDNNVLTAGDVSAFIRFMVTYQ